MQSSPQQGTPFEGGDNTSHSSTVNSVIKSFKSYLDKKVKTLSSGLVSQTATKTQKIIRVAKTEKLKFTGNKDQFIFNSELSGTLDEVSFLLAAQKTEKAEEKLAELSKRLKRRQKISNSPTKVKQVGSLLRKTTQRNSPATLKSKSEFVKHRREP